MKPRCLAMLLAAAIADAQSGGEVVKPLVVMITAHWDDAAQNPARNGAGILFGYSSDKLYIATANHVVREGPLAARKVEVDLAWLPGAPKPADIAPAHFDGKLDLAVLTLPNAGTLAAPKLPFDRLGDPSRLARSSIVRAMGYPDGQRWFVSPLDDRVSSFSHEAVRFASTSVKVGYSGGALFNDEWRIVGLVRSDSSQAEAVRIERVIERLTGWGYPVRLAFREPTPRDGAVWIEPGTFLMGCSEGDTECRDNETKPPVPTTIGKGFWMKDAETTQAEYLKVMRHNPSYFKGPDRPVEQVSRDDAYLYCMKAGGRLPSPAEWEYAARAGTTGPRYGEPGEIAWGDHNAGGETHDVRGLKANAWGLYDMLGNVSEWTSGAYYSSHLETLGGSWFTDPRALRASRRAPSLPASRVSHQGFRCVWDAPSN